MKLDIFNIEEFIKVNHLKEVSSPIGLTAAKMPNPDGIFSYEIFGYTTEERKNNFGYIDLHGYYMHPQCVLTLSRMGSLGKIITGEKYAVIVDRKIHIVDPDERDDFPDAETGTDFFYDNWDNIFWNEVGITTKDAGKDADEFSVEKKNRLRLFKDLKRNEAFTKYWLVLPPYYRDFNISDSAMSMGDDINKVYKELILKTMAMRKGFADDFGFSSVGSITKARIQDLLGILYQISLNPVTGRSIDINTKELKGNPKFSILRRNLIGRTLDFSGSSVITAPQISSTETVDDSIHFGETFIPIQTACAMYKPFIVNKVYETLDTLVDGVVSQNRQAVKHVDRNQWSLNEIDKVVTRFIKSASEKDEPVNIEYLNSFTNKKEKRCFLLTEINKKGEKINRYITWIDLLYISTYDVLRDKYMLNTRYPVTNNQNIHPSKAILLSTTKTRNIIISIYGMQDQEYKAYPYIDYSRMNKFADEHGLNKYNDPDPKPKSAYDLLRSTVIGNGVLKSLGADYDGDMMFFKSLYTKEAGNEAANIIFKKTNFLNADGSLSRGLTKISKDCTISLYELTKD